MSTVCGHDVWNLHTGILSHAFMGFPQKTYVRLIDTYKLSLGLSEQMDNCLPLSLCGPVMDR